jgi:hypothetical protein
MATMPTMMIMMEPSQVKWIAHVQVDMDIMDVEEDTTSFSLPIPREYYFLPAEMDIDINEDDDDTMIKKSTEESSMTMSIDVDVDIDVEMDEEMDFEEAASIKAPRHRNHRATTWTLISQEPNRFPS